MHPGLKVPPFGNRLVWPPWETGGILQIINPSHDPANQLLGTYPGEMKTDMDTKTCSSFLHNHQKQDISW